MRSKLLKRGMAAAIALFASPLVAATSASPPNLGFGLDKLVESRAIVKNDPTRGVYHGYATEQAENYAAMAIVDDDTGRVQVDIVPGGRIDFDALQATLKTAFPSMTINAVDKDYRGTGMIEAFVSIDDAASLAKFNGVKAVFLSLKPYVRTTNQPVPMPSVLPGDHLYKVGTAFDQGVLQHRVDRISQIYNPSAPVNYDGNGISVGLLSNNFDKRAAAPHAATAVANFDLPGSPTNPWNTHPVVVLQDDTSTPITDEGRAMSEIVYKMTPRARIAFATANGGELNFANNIRALAGMPGFTYPAATQQGFKANVIADDVGYFDEPWYEDGIIGNAIDDVVATGVSYFSSAGNDIGINGYESSLRIVPNGTGLTAAAGNTALAGTNIDLTGVPTNLYAGGFHNFNPAAGQLDVAQLVNYTGTQVLVMQWDDPYDSRDLALDEPPIFTAAGTIDNVNTSATYDGTTTPALPSFVGGQAYVITEQATSGDFDAIVNIFDASNNLILSQDTGTDETVNFFAPTSGQYRIVINRFQTTAGNFTVKVNTADGTAGVTTDLNLLVFRVDTGVYLGTRSLTGNNLATNRPVEVLQFAPPSGQTQLQFVISRANNPVAPQLPTRVRWLIGGNGAGGLGPAEYFAYNTVTTGGHATAAGCNGTAAYPVFRPNIPEGFTSPGPATILFDKNSNRLAVPEIRQQPRIAAADAANESFFSGDTSSDLDTNPNFSGTSAAAPHAAAIAAMVLQSRGGPGSVTPAAMTQILQASTFPHDLDPSSASGVATTSDGGTVSITINSDGDSNVNTGQNDTSGFQVTYSGPGSLASLTFNPAGTDVAGGNVTGGNNGPQDDVGSFPATISYFENSFPGLAFIPIGNGKPFTLGPLVGLAAGDITQPLNAAPFTGFSNPSPPPAPATGVFRTMSLAFPTGNFTTGAVLHFTVGRGAQHSSAVGTVAAPVNGTTTINQQADLFGGGVFIPSGVVINNGMAFSGTTTAGGTFSGTIKNVIGKGYSVVDGYGFIDASVAVGLLSGTGTAAPASGLRGATTLLTVNVTPGSAPPSTGLTVTANLTGIGGSASAQLFDDGTHGDVTLGDNIFSLSTTVGASAPVGAKALPVAITDAQGRSGNTSINFTVLAPTAPTGVGSAVPNSVSVTEATLLTVAVTPGTGPASTGIAVTADLSSIGGSATQALHDDGGNSFSFSATVALGTTPGAKNLPVTIADAQARSSTTSIALTVKTPSSPTGVGSASPNSGPAGATSLFSVVVTPGANPISSGLTVTADLTSVGGAATQALTDDGLNGDVTAADGIYSANVTIGAVAAGPKVVPVTITDAQGRSGSATIAFNVQGGSAPSGIGLATPATVNEGSTTVLVVSVTAGSNPTSTGLAVTVDLTAIGGSATQTFFDDGSNGDQIAGDGVFTFTASVGVDAPAGPVTLPVTITDGQSRSGSASIHLNITDVIFQSGFDN